MMARITKWRFKTALRSVEDGRGACRRIDRKESMPLNAPVTRSSTRLAAGDSAPAFALPDTGGREVTVDARACGATVLVFTSNGCPYALAWHDRLQAVARDYADRGVAFVQMVSNDDELQPADTVQAMRARETAGEVAGVYLKDGDQAVARQYGATATPEVFVVDRQGVVRYHGAPDGDHDDPAQGARWVREAVDALLAGTEVVTPTTSPNGCSLKWRVELLWWDGCPTHEEAGQLLDTTLADMGRHDVRVTRVRIANQADAASRSFPGSPTFQVGGFDLFPTDAAPTLGCRVYQRPDGRVSPLPSADQLRERLRDALARPWDLPGWVDFRRTSTQPKGAS
jgi:peroxiredoxin